MNIPYQPRSLPDVPIEWAPSEPQEKPKLSDRSEAFLERIRSMPKQTDEEVEARNAKLAAEAAESKFAFFFEKAHVPDRHKTRKVKTDGAWGEKLTTVRDLLGKDGVIIALIGGRGSGKTQMAVECIRALAREGKVSNFCTAMSFFMRIKSTYRKDATETESDVIRELSSPSLLVIDEIARRSESEWENNLLFELLNRRYNDMLDTIVICNLPKDEFEASMGSSLVSRMTENGGIVDCNWGSFR